MKLTLYPVLVFLATALVLPDRALARDVYPERRLEDIYVLATDGSSALIKTKGVEREAVVIGDVVGEERFVVVAIDSLSITVKSDYGDVAARLPVGGGVGF